MKPCAACPFRPDSPMGLWEPAHYLAIAYLGSVRTPLPVHFPSMNCHAWNPLVNPHLRREDSKPCGGWARSLYVTESFRLRLCLPGYPDADDGEPVLTPEEMARLNGLDMDRLPPLEWQPDTPGYEGDYLGWAQSVIELWHALNADPGLAREYVVSGSPLDVGAQFSDVVRSMGFEKAKGLYQRAGLWSEE